jgi:hypothetical protein
MRFFHPMVRPRELSRVNLRTLCAHRACLTYGLRSETNNVTCRSLITNVLKYDFTISGNLRSCPENLLENRMPTNFWDDPSSAWRSWSNPDEFAHFNSPEGGAGPGSFNTFAQIGHATPPPGVPHHDSPVGKSVGVFTIRDGMSPQEANAFLNSLPNRLIHARPTKLYFEMVFLNTSFSAGVVTGVAKGLKNSVVGLVNLVVALGDLERTLVWAELYDLAAVPQYRKHKSLDRLPVALKAALVIARFELKKAAERRAALFKELQYVFDHKVEFLESIPAKVRDEYINKWNRLLALGWDPHSGSLVNYKSAFEMGEIFGEVLLDIVSIIYAVRGVVKLISEIPELWALVSRSLTKGAGEVAVVTTEEGLSEAGAARGAGVAKSVVEEAGEAKPGPVTSAPLAKGGLPATTEESVADKLQRYLLNPDHPEGKDKAKFFERALGYNRQNADGLAKQLVFNEQAAVQTDVTPYGTKFNQIIDVVGDNGRTVPVKTAWIRNNDGVVRLITAVPGD